MTWLIAAYAEKYIKSLLSIFTSLTIAIIPDVDSAFININGILDIFVKMFQIVASGFAIVVAIITIKSYLERKKATSKQKQTKPKKR